MKIRVAHSPDSDDAFMFYALAKDKIDTRGYEFEHELNDIESLNQAALNGTYEVTAVSIHSLPYLHQKYALLNSGASMGEGYGPKIISREPMVLEALAGKLVAVPGEKTSAFLGLKLAQPEARHEVVPFDRIIEAVEDGRVDAGVVIHEGQLFYEDHGLHLILDLGQWWKNETGLPMPLGGNVVRRDLGTKAIGEIAGLLEQSIRYSLEHREEALDYALEFGRGLDRAKGDRFVEMYVNQRTLDYGEDGRRAVQLFLDRGFDAGLIPNQIQVDFVIPS
jgi:1,4-dihydroxy-6-naphthoate synthase